MVIAAIVAGAAVAGPAFAHASLRSSDPADGAVLEAAPTEIVLRFTEPVDLVDDAIRLLDGSGTQVEIGVVDQALGSDTLRAAVPELANGTYAVG